MARIDDYRESFRLASIELRKAGPQQMAELSGAGLFSGENGVRGFRLPFLGSAYRVEIGEEVDVRKEDSAGEVPFPEKILIAHYLLRASNRPQTGNLITFRQVPDGKFYFDAFQRRARDPFVATFGGSPELFLKCAGALGGIPVDSGDAAMRFQVLPKISLQLVLWKGDDEFPPDGSVLFDEAIQTQLPAEDIAVLSGMLVYRLMGIARSMQAGQ